MQTLIDQLFQSQGLEKKAILGLDLYGHSEPDKTSYWLVIHGKPELTPDCQAHWLTNCKRATADPGLEKNINLLIVWQVDSLDEQTSRLVNHTEEDGYFFKKHVLSYTENEFIALNAQVEKTGLESVFSSVLTCTETFSSYKKQHNQEGWQNLLYRLAIKLSVLTIQSSNPADLVSLEKNIKDEIQESSDKNILMVTDAVLLELTDDQASFEPEDLFKLIDEKIRMYVL